MYGIHDLGFIDRGDELNELQQIKERRRIGKTRLVYESFDDYIYVFVWPDKSLPWILEGISEEKGIPLFSRFSCIEYMIFN